MLASRRLLHRAAALAVVAVFALAGCSGGRSGSDNGQGYVAGSDGVVRVAAGDRENAPGISGKDLEGKPVSLADFRGKVVVVNVWGSWCNPCRGEARNLQQVYAETQARGVQFLGINTHDSSQANALSFERKFGITYPSLWDPDAREILKFRGKVNPSGLPATLVIDRHGRIAATVMHALTTDELHSMLDPVLAESA